MAIIKKNEFGQMNEKSLNDKLVELKKDLMKYNSQRSSGTPPENPGRVREVRKTIARIYTKLGQKKTEAPKVEPKKEVKTEIKVKKEKVKEVKKR